MGTGLGGGASGRAEGVCEGAGVQRSCCSGGRAGYPDGRASFGHPNSFPHSPGPRCHPHNDPPTHTFPTGYNSYFARSYGVCDNAISMECLNNLGGDLCLAAALAPFIKSATDVAGRRAGG